MYNNTLTLSEKYYISSSIVQKEQNATIEKTPRVLNFEESIFTFGYLYSIELNRNKIKKDLSEYFDFESHYEELDFLAANNKLLQTLPSIGRYIKNQFDNNSKLELELMSEDKDWQTLFINIHTRLNWEKSNQFVNTFLVNLFKLYPEISSKLNVSIIQDEF